jgi:hypothetical protein
MTHTLTPVSQYDAAAITMPDNGDANTIDSLEGGLQKIADRAQLAVGAVASHLQWAETLTVDAGGTASSFTVRVGAIRTVALTRADGSIRLAFASAASLTAAHLESGSSLSANTWYYVYAYDPGDGSVAYQISTTAPRSWLTNKSGADGHLYMYLGCFRAATGGAPVPSHTIRGVTTYLQGIPTGYASRSGPTSGFEAISLAALVPPHARSAVADITLTGDGRWRCVGDGGDTAGVDRFARPIVLSTSQEIEWSSASSGGINVTVRTYSA